MTRRWIWLQLLLGWSPVWALFVTLIVVAHPGVGFATAAFLGLRLMASAAVLSLLVRRLTRWLPWPHPMRPSFVIVHVIAAAVFAFAWILLYSVLASLHHGGFVVATGVGLGPFLVTGVWLYVTMVGVTYASQATERAARIEAIAARSQLAALRAQLNPHFLFNALHTVVQLIPREPQRAAQAAEQIAGLLRTTIEEDRDIVSLAAEWAFVERYLDLERIRFGDRLHVQTDLPEPARRASLPSFALQTLVENAVRHGAGPRVEPTSITITGRVADDRLTLTVHDNGTGADSTLAMQGGTGLARLRERLAALYDGRARLVAEPGAGGGFTATLVVPQTPDHAVIRPPVAHDEGTRR